jgi:cytochrome P450
MQLSAALRRDVDPVAATAGLLAAAAVHSILRLWLRPRPYGPNCYYLQRKDTGMNPFLRLFFGDFPAMIRGEPGDRAKQFRQLRERLGRKKLHMAWYSGFSVRVTLTSPEDVRHVLIDSADVYIKSVNIDFLQPLLGIHGLVTIRDEAYHSFQFHNVSHAFSANNIRAMGETTMRDGFAEMIRRLQAVVPKDEHPHDIEPGFRCVIHHSLTKATLSIISEAAFKTQDFATLADKPTESLISANVLMLLGPWLYTRLPLRRVRRQRGVRDAIAPMVRRVVSAARAKISTTPSGGAAGSDAGNQHSKKKLIDYLAENPELTEDMILDHSITFVFAGHDTTANALNWMMYLVATHPQVQETLAEELGSALAAGAMPSVELVRSLPYLQAVCLETLRFVPPVATVSREATRDDVLPSGTYIPPRTIVIISAALMHRDPDVWGADVDEFRPERWVEDPELRGRVTPCSFVPFAAGKRQCIGREFALLEMELCTAMFFRAFHVEWPKDEPKPYQVRGVVTRPKKPFSVILHHRN